MVEPLCVAYHGVKMSGVKQGDSALVLGGGPIGQYAISALKALGATFVLHLRWALQHRFDKCVHRLFHSTIILSEPFDQRRERGFKTGATHVVDPVKQNLVEEVAKIIGHRDGSGVDVAIECAGVQSSLDAGIRATKAKGTIVNVAMWAKKVCYLPPYTSSSPNLS